jgi:hypothetical protein
MPNAKGQKNKAAMPPVVPKRPSNTAVAQSRARAKARGIGSTTTFAPVAIGSTFRQARPNIVRTGDKLTIEHCEFICNVADPGTQVWNLKQFNNVSNNWALSPGNIVSFPWLADEARGWEEFVLESCEFIYESRCPTSTLGSVQMVFDYDPNDTAPTSEQSMLSYTTVADGPCWNQLSITVNPTLAMAVGPKKYVVLTGANSYNRNNSCGNLYVATTDGSGTALRFGKIFVKYKFSFFSPTVGSAGAAAALVDLLYTTTCARSTPFTGVTPYFLGNNQLGCVTTGGTQINFPIQAYYRLEILVAGTGLAGNPTIVATNCSYVLATSLINAAQTSQLLLYFVTCTDFAANMTFNFTAVATTVTVTETSVAIWPNTYSTVQQQL